MCKTLRGYPRAFWVTYAKVKVWRETLSRGPSKSTSEMWANLFVQPKSRVAVGGESKRRRLFCSLESLIQSALPEVKLGVEGLVHHRRLFPEKGQHVLVDERLCPPIRCHVDPHPVMAVQDIL